jgi:hypothetical protein
VLVALAKSVINIRTVLISTVNKVWLSCCLTALAFRAFIVSIIILTIITRLYNFDSTIARMSICGHVKFVVFGVAVYVQLLPLCMKRQLTTVVDLRYNIPKYQS